jgi:hypothetical protein
MEVGGIETHCFRNPQRDIKLRRKAMNLKEFQFLFGFVCLCLFLLVLTSIWHKSGTNKFVSIIVILITN